MNESGAPVHNGRWTHFISSTKGALVALGSCVLAGAFAALWLAGLTSLPGEVEALRIEVEEFRRHNTAQDTLIVAMNRRVEWIICTTIPPNRRDVLQALNVTCQFQQPIGGQFSEPIPDLDPLQPTSPP